MTYIVWLIYLYIRNQQKNNNMGKKDKSRRKCPCKEKRQNSLAEKMADLMYRFGKDPKGTVLNLEVGDLVLLLGQKGKVSENDYETVFQTYLRKASVRSLIKFAEKYGNEDKKEIVLDEICSRKSFTDGMHLFLNSKEKENKLKGLKMMKSLSYHPFIECVYRAFRHHELLVQGKLEGTLKKEIQDCLQKWQKILEFEKMIGCDCEDSKYRVGILKQILNPNAKAIQIN